MTTSERIVEEALELFAQKGFDAVSVGEIARAVGIKAPSLYKHYESKQAIFQAILERMQHDYERCAAQLMIDGADAAKDANVFGAVSEEGLVQMGTALFMYFLHDPYVSRFRKMLTLEQFRSGELARWYSKQYVDDPLAYQSQVFAQLVQAGLLKAADPQEMAISFFAPIYLLLTLCDREPEREQQALAQLEKHIRHFAQTYQKEG